MTMALSTCRPCLCSLTLRSESSLATPLLLPSDLYCAACKSDCLPCFLLSPAVLPEASLPLSAASLLESSLGLLRFGGGDSESESEEEDEPPEDEPLEDDELLPDESSEEEEEEEPPDDESEPDEDDASEESESDELESDPVGKN